jgi:peptidoglycan/LPS O-acetylase OafA/YrhL
LRRLFGLDLLDNRYPSLHGLRVVGILLVLQYHVTQSLGQAVHLPIGKAWEKFSLSIFFGMDLFFVLSGFLIGSILLRSVETSKPTPPGYLRRFYLRRAFRTFPSYYVALTFLALTTVLLPWQRHNLPYDYAYLTNYFPYSVMPWGWSLCVEEHFYLLVPFLFIGLRKMRSDGARLAVLGALFVTPPLLRLYLYLYDRDALGLAYVHTHTRFDALVGGILTAFVQYRWGDRLRRWLEQPAARGVVAVATLACLWVLTNPGIVGDDSLAAVFYWGTVTSFMYFGLIVLLVNGGDGWLARFFSAPLFRLVATLGYGVYLTHEPFCFAFINPSAKALVQRWGWSMVVVWPLSLAGLVLGALAFAYVMHVLIEKPALRLRDRVAG